MGNYFFGDIIGNQCHDIGYGCDELSASASLISRLNARYPTKVNSITPMGPDGFRLNKGIVPSHICINPWGTYKMIYKHVHTQIEVRLEYVDKI